MVAKPKTGSASSARKKPFSPKQTRSRAKLDAPKSSPAVTRKRKAASPLSVDDEVAVKEEPVGTSNKLSRMSQNTTPMEQNADNTPEEITAQAQEEFIAPRPQVEPKLQLQSPFTVTPQKKSQPFVNQPQGPSGFSPVPNELLRYPDVQIPQSVQVSVRDQLRQELIQLFYMTVGAGNVTLPPVEVIMNSIDLNDIAYEMWKTAHASDNAAGDILWRIALGSAATLGTPMLKALAALNFLPSWFHMRMAARAEIVEKGLRNVDDSQMMTLVNDAMTKVQNLTNAVRAQSGQMQVMPNGQIAPAFNFVAHTGSMNGQGGQGGQGNQGTIGGQGMNCSP